MKKMGKRCLICLVILFSPVGCNTPLGGKWEYKFVNSTGYSIQITLNEDYYTSNDTEAVAAYSRSFSIYSHSSKTVYIESGSVDFQWTASSSNDNSKIYPAVDGSTVTFKER